MRTVRGFSLSVIESIYDIIGGNDLNKKYIVKVALQWPCMYKAQLYAEIMDLPHGHDIWPCMHLLGGRTHCGIPLRNRSVRIENEVKSERKKSPSQRY